MADESEERSELEAKLELPTLSLRRRRRGSKKQPEPVVDAAQPEPAAATEPAPVAAAAAVAEPEPPAVVSTPIPVAPPAWSRVVMVRQAVTVAPASGDPSDDAPTRSIWTPAPPEPSFAEPPPVEPPVAAAVASEAAVIEEPTSFIGFEDAEPLAPLPGPAPTDDATDHATADVPDDVPAPRRRIRRWPQLPGFRLPTLHLAGRVAAVVTGLIVGLTGVLLVYAAEQACNAVRGTTSCGGAGVLLLVAIFALMVLEGLALLRAFVVPDPLSTSFLGVGVLAVVTMLFLLGIMGSWTMLVVVPLVTAAGYLVSWWATSRFGSEPVHREPYIDV